AKNNAETSAILDCISLGTVQLFHQQTKQHSRTTNNSQAAALLDTLSVASPKTENDESDNSVWLVPPLIAKLQSGVQGSVLQKAVHLLESSNTFLKSKQDLERNHKSLFSHQPFQSLILTCLKGQDDQREGLLSSILTQMDKFIASFASQLCGNRILKAFENSLDPDETPQNVASHQDPNYRILSFPEERDLGLNPSGGFRG
ncbi:hypothetical protein DPMN_033626, partial [Dreissena polymorpha]